MRALSLVANTLGGRRLAAACAKEGMGPEETRAVILQLADGFMFAGMVGTGHLTTRTLARLKSDPEKYLPLWEAGVCLVCAPCECALCVPCLRRVRALRVCFHFLLFAPVSPVSPVFYFAMLFL
jgi:hypothetical protein